MASGDSVSHFKLPDRLSEGPTPHRVVWSIVSPLIGLAFLGVVVVVWAAEVATCARVRPSRAPELPSAKPRRLDPKSPQDIELVSPLVRAWGSAQMPASELSVWVVDSDEVQAASLGNGEFILWSGLNTLNKDLQFAVASHEVAHDQLLHGRREAEVRDVTDFIGEVIGFAAEKETTKTLKQWSGVLILPRYNKAQELEADREALRIMNASGISQPAGVMCTLFAELRRRYGQSGGGFFSNHPELSERISALAETQDGVVSGERYSCRPGD
jgi:predicted Zn-dependent protease